MDNLKMGKFIAERRKAKGMTQLDLANKLHITDKAISKWERGLSSPDIGLLSQLADTLDVSVNELLKGDLAGDEVEGSKSNVSEVLHYAEKSAAKKYNRIRLIFSLGFMMLLFIGIIVCAIVDVALTSSFTWSLYPISSCIFAWCVLFPVILSGAKGIRFSLLALTLLIVPYLYVLTIIAENGQILKVGAAVSVASLTFLWIGLFIIKRFKSRKLLGAGILTVLAAPVCVLVNYSLSLTLTPEAGAFDIWDVLGIVILLIAGLALIFLDWILKKRK